MKKILTLLIIPLLSFGQDWVFKGYYNGEARHHPITFSNQKYGFVIAGQNSEGDYLQDSFRYDSELELWEQLSDFPGGPRGYAYGVSNENYGYVGFGSNNDGYPNDFWRYDMINNVWEELANFPFIGRNHPAMILLDNKIYVGLGSVDGENLGDWWEYDILQNSWSEKSSFNFGDRHHPFYFSIENIAYVGFGHGNYTNNNINIYNDFYKYNPFLDEWSELNNFPSEGRVAGTQFSYNGKGYVLSGDGDDHGPLDSGEFWEYDPILDNWTQLASHPGGARWAPGSFIINCHVYLTSGYEAETDTYYNDLIKYKLLDLCGCTNENAFNYNVNSTIDDDSCCYISGCTNSNALNYNPEACFEDGSCIPIVLGCDNSSASNYNPLANSTSSFIGPDYIELGTGSYHYNDLWNMVFNCYEDVVIKTIDLLSETSFTTQIDIQDNNGNQIYTQEINLQSGLNQIELNAEIIAGLNYQIGVSGNNEGLYRNNNVNPDFFPINLLNVIEIVSNTTDSPFDYYYYFYNWQLEISCENILGCMDMAACNYDDMVTEDDGSCIYPEEFYDCYGNCINDIDKDGMCDEIDNCINDYNPNQNDTDNDGIGDDCDPTPLSTQELSNAPKISKIVDLLGRKVAKEDGFGLLLYIYDDGSVQKKYNIITSHLQ